MAGPRARRRRDADNVTAPRTLVAGDSIVRPEPGRTVPTAAGYYPVSTEQREFTVTCPSFRIFRQAGQTFITDHPALPIIRRPIRGVPKQSEVISRCHVIGP